MARARRGRFLSVLAWLWQAVDATRRTLLNLLFLALVGGLVWAFFALRGGPAPVAERTTLVLAPAGPLREQAAGSLRGGALDALRARDNAQVRLRDLLHGLDSAAKAPEIERVLLLTDDFAGAGLASMRDVAAAIGRVRAAGKQVVAWGSSFDQRQYFLAAHANEVWLHPMGEVEVRGYGAQRSYLKDALDKLGVTAHVVRAGEFKNAAETFSANAPSEATQEADKALFDALWERYATDVERARQLPPGSLQNLIDSLPEALAAEGGDLAQLALKNKLVDALKTRDEMRAALVERGVADGRTFRQVSFGAWLARQPAKAVGDAVGVVVAEGPIIDGDAAAGTVGARSTAELIRQARENERVKAVLLRVNSPGGSAFGSEVVRRELELTRAAGKPVVVSMGDVAASGGYWISLAADELIADEATITGSIGVVALLPTAEKALGTLGVATAGYTTSWLVGAYDPRRGLDPRFEQLVQLRIDQIYADFTGRAAKARKTEVPKIDAVARGRVWTGAQAKERGLVDRVGGFDAALKAAAARAKLADGHAVLYLERQPRRLERLLAWLGVSLDLDALDALAPALPPAAAALERATAPLHEELAWLAEAFAGRAPAALAHCLCEAP